MKEEKISIDDYVLHKTLVYESKFNTFFFNNFIKDNDSDDSQFSFTVLNGLIHLTNVSLKKQGLVIDNIDGEFIRYDVNILINPKLMNFIEKNLCSQYYSGLITTIVPSYNIIEDSNIPEDFIYLVENNNCININIER